MHAKRLTQALKGYDAGVVRYLEEGFTHGFRLGYEGTGQGTASQNLKSAYEHPEVISGKLGKEYDKGRIAGPFQTPPFHPFFVSPIGVVPKKQPGSFRIIHHLSHPREASVNAGIPDSNAVVHYASTDDAIQCIKSMGRDCWLVKMDVQSAFKIIPVHPDDYYLLGFSWDGLWFYDKTLPMGCRSSCSIFEKLSSCVEYICVTELEIDGVVHLLDDFLFITKSKAAGMRARDRFEAFCTWVGIPLAPEKREGPEQCMVFAGIELDTRAMEARLPDDKLVKCKERIAAALERSKLTLKELQSIIGLLNFACKVVPSGRAFLRRMINLTIGVRQPSHHIRLNKHAKADLSAWLLFLQQFNGKSFFLGDEWVTNSALHLYTDASGSIGYGAVFGKKWFHGVWPQHWASLNITFLELFPIVAALVVWSPYFKNSRVILHTDNASAHC